MAVATADNRAIQHGPSSGTLSQCVARAPARANLAVPNTAASSAAVRGLVRAMAGGSGAPYAWVEEFALAVDEAFSNAVRHGTGTAADAVEVRLEADDIGIGVELRYRGEPFDTQLCQLPDDVYQFGGRGRYLMHALLDAEEYRFADGMTTLRVFKRF